MEYLTTEQELKVQTKRLEKQIKINEELNKENQDLLDDVIGWMNDFRGIGKLLGLRWSKFPKTEDIKEAIKELIEAKENKLNSYMNDSKEVEKIMGFIQELIDERDALKKWKEEMLQVESEWDCQRIGKLLKIGWGESIRKNIEPKIREILKAIQNLKDVEGRHTQIAMERLFEFLPKEKL
jgi:hypothetical protein